VGDVMKKTQLWLDFGLLFGMSWPRLSYYGELLNGVSGKLFNFYDAAVDKLGLPFGAALINLATSPLVYFIGNQFMYNADKTVLFIISAVLTLIISLVFFLWLIVDFVYWILNVNKPYRAFNFIRKLNVVCFIILALYCLEWILSIILSSIYQVPLFGVPSFGVYMIFVIGITKVVVYFKLDEND
jgi:hypothetical protein